MASIRLNNFAGALPFANPRLIPENVGVSAENVDFSRGRLEARYNFLPTTQATVLSEPPDDDLKTRRWVARSPVVDDIHNRWYYLDSAGRLRGRSGLADYIVGVGTPEVSVSAPTVDNSQVAERTTETVLVPLTEFERYGWSDPFVQDGRLMGTKEGTVQDGTLGAAEYLIREKGVKAAAPELIRFEDLRVAGTPTDGRLIVYTKTTTTLWDDDDRGRTYTTVTTEHYAVTAQRLVDLGLLTIGARDGLFYGNITPDVITANAMSAAALQAEGFDVTETTDIYGRTTLSFPSGLGLPLQTLYHTSDTATSALLGTTTTNETVAAYQYTPSVAPGDTVYEITVSYDAVPSDAIVSDSRVYAFSLVSEFGEEGALSEPVEVAVDGRALVDGSSLTFTATLTNRPLGQTLSAVRVYRPFNGVWRFVTEIAISTNSPSVQVQVTDSVPDAALGEEAPNLNWTPPPEYLAGFISTANGYFVGWAQHYVYFSVPYLPHAWPDEYYISLQDNIVSVVETQNGLIVLTNNRVYLLTGGRPESMQVVPVDSSQPCLDPESAVDMGEFVIYRGKTGFVKTDGYQIEPFAEEAFPASFFASGTAMDLDAARSGDDYLVRIDGVLYSIDPRGAASVIALPQAPTGFERHVVYARGVGIALADGSAAVLAPGANREGSWAWTSKQLALPQGARTLSAMRVIAEKLSASASLEAEITYFYGNEVVATHMLDTPDITRLPPGTFDSLQLTLRGQDIAVDEIILANSMTEVRHAA